LKKNDRDIFEAKLTSSGGLFSGAELARELGISRAAVHKRIQRLRALGRRIEGVPGEGYFRRSSPDDVSTPPVAEGLGTPYHYFERLGSTQDDVKRRALAGAPEGTLVLAEEQTAGRGRLGRAWLSPRGGLWYSLLLRPAVSPAAAPALALVAGLAWVALLRERGVAAGIKWPNDIWWGGRKLGGILTEMSSETDRVHWVVLGVGVNVNNPLPAGTAPAVSLREALGAAASRRDWLAGWLKAFAKAYSRYIHDGFAPFRPEFERWSVLRGKTVVFSAGNASGRGRVLGVDAEGRLRVMTRGGTVRLHGGEVTLSRRKE
jgi:BirA family biotin operon repressor/biotin-[acetyl-CoA-carboxylase] ligase